MTPIVTVIISTYNSAQFLVETLDSVKNQTWEESELIITDDCSTDDTIKIASKWLNTNKERFVRVKLLTSEINTGISANANRGLKESTGKWLKFLGADDTLLPDCLTDNINFIQKDPNIRVLFSKVNIFNESFNPGDFLTTNPDGPIKSYSILWPGRTSESQYRMLLVCDRVDFSPSVFIHRDLILSLGGFDERFRFFEDYPLWLKLTKSGHKLYFMDQVTVNYRQHRGAINNTGRPLIVSPNYFKSESFRKTYTYPFLPPILKAEQKFKWIASQFFRIDFLNRKTIINRCLYTILTIYLNPFRYLIKFFGYIRKDEMSRDFYL